MSTVFAHPTDASFINRLFKQIRQKITKEETHAVLTLRYLLDDLLEFNNDCLELLGTFDYDLATLNIRSMIQEAKHLDEHHDRPYTLINHQPVVTEETIQPKFSFPSILDRVGSVQDELQTLTRRSETNAVTLDRITYPALMHRLAIENEHRTREEKVKDVCRYLFGLLYDHGIILEEEENLFFTQWFSKYADSFIWAYANTLFNVDTHYEAMTETWRFECEKAYALAYKPYLLKENVLYKSMVGRNETKLSEILLANEPTLESEREMIIAMVMRTLVCTLMGIRIEGRGSFMELLDYSIDDFYSEHLNRIMDKGLQLCQ